MSETEIKALVVDRFPLSATRPALWANLLWVVGELRQAVIYCDLWLDGSFVTKKIDPGDVDFVLDIPAATINGATPIQTALLRAIAGRQFEKDRQLHSFVMFNAPAGHNQYAESERLHAQWNKDFGFSFVKREPKGIVILEVSV